MAIIKKEPGATTPTYGAKKHWWTNPSEAVQSEYDSYNFHFGPGDIEKIIAAAEMKKKMGKIKECEEMVLKLGEMINEDFEKTNVMMLKFIKEKAKYL